MDLLELADRVERLTEHGCLRFSVCSGKGWITTDSEPTIRTLCDLYNNRTEVAAALRSRAQEGV